MPSRVRIADLAHPARPAEVQRDVRSRWLLPAAALAVYLGVSYVFFWASLRTDLSSVAVGSGADPWQFMWLLRWWPYALGHGINPLVTNVLFAPYGISLAWVTSIPAAAVLAAPLTLTVGPVITFNAAMLLAPALSAWAGFLLCRYLTHAFWPALVGGYLFGFSSYEVGQMSEGHLNLVWSCLVPLAVLLCLLAYDRKLRWRTFVAVLALIVVVQVGVSTEILASATLFGGVALAAAWLMNPEGRRDLGTIAYGLAAAYLLAGLIMLPYEFHLYAELDSLRRVFYPAEWYSVDLLNYVVPTGLTQLGGGLFAPLSARFLIGTPGEAGAYLGVPQLLTACLAAVTFRKSVAGKLLIITGATAVVASLGPTLHIAGHGGHLLSVPMPWALADRIPVLRFALPDRFALHVTLIASVAVALWLGRAPERAWTRGALAAATVAFLIPAVGASELHTRVVIPPFFATQAYRQYLQPGDIVLVIPYGKSGQSMLWQASTGMYFRMVGGYLGSRIPPELARWAVVDHRRGQIVQRSPAVMRAFLTAHDVRYVVVAEDPQAHWQSFFSPILGRGRDVDGVTLYGVPGPASRDGEPAFSAVARAR